ncbi:MAG: YitT family protein [Defluviitaleaceae bacterium]|nr:YitT family protein [Defluviitaleaceae bacterium]
MYNSRAAAQTKHMIKWLKKSLYITLAIIIMSMSVNMFLAPHDIAAGGFTGLAIILEKLYSIERSIVLLVGNAAILLMALVFLGKEMFLNTVIGALLLPVFIRLVPNMTLVNDTMLSMVIGSVLFGIAVSILYGNKASSGGTSIPPLILKKYFNFNTSIGLFVTDGVVVILNLLVFSVDSFFYAMSSIFITSVTMNYIESGLNKKKLVYIISDMSDAIKNDILNVVEKGVTIVPVIGAYTQKDMHMLMVTLDSKKYHQLVAVVNRYDDKAFMITDTVSDVHGRGFTYESGSV